MQHTHTTLIGALVGAWVRARACLLVPRSSNTPSAGISRGRPPAGRQVGIHCVDVYAGVYRSLGSVLTP